MLTTILRQRLSLPDQPEHGENSPKDDVFLQMLKIAFLNIVNFPPQIFLFHNVTIIHPQDFTQCTTRGSFVRHWHETAYNMFTFSCLFLLPLIIMITCYTRIFFEISKRLKKDNCKFNLWLILCGSVQMGD